MLSLCCDVVRTSNGQMFWQLISWIPDEAAVPAAPAAAFVAPGTATASDVGQPLGPPFAVAAPDVVHLREDI